MSEATMIDVDTDDVVIETEMSPAAAPVVDGELVDRLVADARAQGLQLSGEGGLLQQLTFNVLLIGTAFPFAAQAERPLRPGRPGTEPGS